MISFLRLKYSIKKAINGSLLVAGTCIGAGMLGIPAVTHSCGFAPGLCISLIVWGFMAATGLLLLSVVLKMPEGSNILSIAEKYLGRSGKVIAGSIFLFLYYTLLTSYIAGGAPLLFSFFGVDLPFSLEAILFTFLIGTLLSQKIQFLTRINSIFTLLMFLSFGGLIIAGNFGINLDSNLGYTNYSKAIWAVPVLLGAFGYHNIIPTLCDYLKRDKAIIRFSLLFGTGIALAMYTIWQYLVLGSCDPALLQKVVSEGKTVITALTEVGGNPGLYIFGKWFGSFALITSLLGVGLSVIDFFKDALSKKIDSHIIPLLLCLLPPLAFVLLNPHLFLAALGIAGGIGEALINGILPILLFWFYKNSKKKSYLFLLTALAAGAIILEIISLFS